MAAQPNAFNMTSDNYNVSSFVNVVPRCNAIFAMNLGDTIATINGIPLFPSATPATVAGDAVKISGNELDEYKGTIKLTFNFPLGANPNILIVQQFYI